jgi:putative tricarboxylic transport membrane protein
VSVDRVLGAAALVLALAVAIAAWGYGLGRPRSPGPGFWPMLIAVAMAALGTQLVLRPDPSFRAPGTSGSRWRSFTIALLTLLFLVLVLEPLGYPVTMLIVLLVQLRWVEDRTWRTSAITAVLGTGISFAVFRVLLKVPLPGGLVPLPSGW